MAAKIILAAVSSQCQVVIERRSLGANDETGKLSRRVRIKAREYWIILNIEFL